jgi:hypothetical protein
VRERERERAEAGWTVCPSILVGKRKLRREQAAWRRGGVQEGKELLCNLSALGIIIIIIIYFFFFLK